MRELLNVFYLMVSQDNHSGEPSFMFCDLTNVRYIQNYYTINRYLTFVYGD